MENQVLNNNPGEEYLYLTFGMLKKIDSILYEKLVSAIKIPSSSDMAARYQTDKINPIIKQHLDDAIATYNCTDTLPPMFYGLFCVKTNEIISGFVLYKISQEDYVVKLCLNTIKESVGVDESGEDIYAEYYCVPTPDIFDDIFGVRIKIKYIENIRNVNLQRWDKKNIVFDLLDVDTDGKIIDILFDEYHKDYETKLVATIEAQVQSLKGILRILEVMQNEIKLTPNSPEANLYFSYLERAHIIREEQRIKYIKKDKDPIQGSLTKDEIIDIVKNYQSPPKNTAESTNPESDPFKLP